jgi:hypothetical protein
LLRDGELRQLFQDVRAPGQPANEDFGASPLYTVNLRDLNVHETAARQALRRYPLDFKPIIKDNDTTVHLVIVGFGSMGQQLALHAARIAHFAPGKTKQIRRLCVTILDGATQTAMDAFQSRYPKFGQICDLRVQTVDPSSPMLLEELGQIARKATIQDELVTCAVCLETGALANDRENLRIALELSKRTNNLPVQTLIYQSTRCGYAAMFPADADGARSGSPLHAFGMVEDIYSWDVLLHESEDRLARTVHAVYAEHRRLEGKTELEWEFLRDNFKDSNRHAADHIDIKLRALGYHQAPLQNGRTRKERFEQDELDVLAPMEHRRYCAERWLDGWEFGPETIRERKINKTLIDWHELGAEEQKKDHEQIQAIPQVLFGVGSGVYR